MIPYLCPPKLWSQIRPFVICFVYYVFSFWWSFFLALDSENVCNVFAGTRDIASGFLAWLLFPYGICCCRFNVSCLLSYSLTEMILMQIKTRLQIHR